MTSGVRTLAIDCLPLYTPLRRSLVHHSGQLLHVAGETLTPRNVSALRSAGILQVFEPETDEAGSLFARAAGHKEISPAALRVGAKLATALYDENGSLLLAAGSAVTSSFADLLKRRRVTRVYVERDRQERKLDQLESYNRHLTALPSPRPMSDQDLALPEESLVKDPTRTLTVEAVNQRVEGGVNVVLPTGEALRERIVSSDPSRTVEPELKKTFMDMHDFCMVGATTLFSHCANGGVDSVAIRQTSARVINALLEHKELLLNLIHITDEREYLASQAVNTSIIAINLAAALGFNARQIHEIAYGAFLHDIGMLRVPTDLVHSRDPLREHARTLVERHTHHGIEMLQKVSGIPMTCPIVAYQHHERLDGSGYPRGRREFLIHTFSRLVMISDIFSAMISPRPFRSCQLPYVGMNTVLRLARERRVDVKAAEAFLQWMGLYPIGSWVILQDGRIAKVIKVIETMPDRPVLRVLYDDSFRRLQKPDTIDTASQQDSPILSACDPPVREDSRALALAGL